MNRSIVAPVHPSLMDSAFPELVLVGGGHTHVQVLRRFAMAPPPGRVTVVLDTPIAVYSGMVPGFVAGQYGQEELEIDVVPLARLARARVVLSRATGLEPGERRLLLEDRPPLPYDLISFDVGSTVAGLELPGVREHALPTRPIAALVRRVHEVIERARAADPATPFRVVVVGAGAGGVELAFTIEARLRSETGRAPRVTWITSAPRPLSEYPERLSRRIAVRAAERGIELRTDVEVVAVRGDSVELRSLDRGQGTQRIEADAVLWVAGAAAQPLFRTSGLPLDESGFLLTRPTLQSVGDDRVFGVGDCATLAESPTPKAGVYAVRQGPYLAENLRHALESLASPGGSRSGPLRAYRPQRDFLTLLNLGDGTALGHKWGQVVEGPWVMRLKDRIDRAFMRRFQVLDSGGSLTPEFASLHDAMSARDGSAMLCGGCAAKVASSALHTALDRLGTPPADAAVVLGLAERDDAAGYRGPNGDLVLTTLDAFRAFTDDPWLVGRVAALNALSDLYAKGVRPRFAQSLVTVPAELSSRAAAEMLYQVLAGARRELDRLGVTLLGGHSTIGPELLVGFAAGGFASDERLLRKSALELGDELVLTKPLGTGVLLHSDMRGRAHGAWVAGALAGMLQDNAAAADLARAHGAHAATDVTGFGLAGHAGELARGSGVRIELDAARVPALPGALELLGHGLRSTSHAQNANGREPLSGPAPSDDRLALLYDPQTAGGLLIAVPATSASALIDDLRAAGYTQATSIGRVVRRARAPEPPGLDLVASRESTA